VERAYFFFIKRWFLKVFKAEVCCLNGCGVSAYLLTQGGGWVEIFCVGWGGCGILLVSFEGLVLFMRTDSCANRAASEGFL
jgi:hypothetical protein